MKKILSVLLFLFTAFAYPLSPSEESRLLKDIAEIKATLKTFMEQTDRRFELMDKRITELREDMNKRFELMDKRFEQINNELNRLTQIMVGVFAGQIALVVAVIGFAYREKAKTDKELEAILKKYGLL